jgi:predicted GIY-YIG superfamily endonuclease
LSLDAAVKADESASEAPIREAMGCYLYRHFAADGSLLYVGISLCAINRLSQHKEGSHWFDQIATVKIERFPDRKQALAAERAAIMRERPKHNLRPSAKQTDEIEHDETKEAAKSRKDLLLRLVRFDPVYSMGEAAEALAMSTFSIGKLIAAGEIGYIERGRRKFISAGS